ncbi:COG3650 family protein [Halomonas icarae]|uniref:C-type lysozyme, inhibitor n=1 Tax=Halomonas icarae TaxID=2691040 RepID=A0A7X4VYU8_9GAMM|nr:C-type lysozyme, inhibitor [Halomonas icarae]MDR5901800.1 C-type lysozyme, inhibitor [Halomonas icarae]NAW12702.1 C-type lysozyme, inhibitor [Halomonas icarae]
MFRLHVFAALGLSLLLAACATAPAPITSDAHAPLLPSTLFPGDAEAFVAWRCSPDQGVVTAGPEGELRVWSTHGAWRLTPAVVASGERFEQGELSFRNTADGAIVESPRGQLACQASMRRLALTREQRPGVMFHARGNEPGWTASLAHDRPEVFLSLDHGSREQRLPYRVTQMDNEAGRVVLASGRGDTPFELRIEARACFDDMSGEPFPARVTLNVGGEQYRGCGQGIAP